MERWLTRQEVADILNISERTLRKIWEKMIAEGLKAIKIEGQWRVRPASLEKYLSRKESEAC